MTVLDDRLLEFALREVLGAPLPEDDLVDAIERRLAEQPAPPIRHRRARRWPFGIAAAAAAVVVAIALSTRESSAIADGELLVAAPGETFGVRRTVAAHEVVWARSSSAATVREADGTTLRLQPGAALQRRGAAGYRVLAGDVRVASPSNAVTCEAGDAVVKADPGSELILFLPPVPDSPEPPMQHDGFLSSLSTLPVTFTLTVLLGSAEIAVGQERARVDAGQSTQVQDAASARTDAAKAAALFVAVAREWPAPVDEASRIAVKDLTDQEDELSRLLLRSTGARRATMGDILRAVDRKDASDELLGRAVRLACLCDEKRLDEHCAAAFARQPGAFGIEEQIALAEKGDASVRPKLQQAIRDGGLPVTAMANAALAIGGDVAATSQLAQHLRGTMAEAFADVRVFDARCAAAASYALLGRDGPKRQLIADLEQAVAELDSPQKTAEAASYVIRASYFLGGTRPRFSHVAARIGAFAVPSLGDGLDPAKVRETVRRLADAK